MPHLLDHTTVFELAVGEHRGAREALIANLSGLGRDVVADPIPERMIEKVHHLCELAVMDTEARAAHDRRAVEEADRRVELHRHQRAVMAPAHRAGDVMADAEG